jgi:hypothetical protein
VSGGFAVAPDVLSAGGGKIKDLGQAGDLLGGAVTAGLLDMAVAAGHPAAAVAFKGAAQQGAQAFVQAGAVYRQAAQNLADSGAQYARVDDTNTGCILTVGQHGGLVPPSAVGPAMGPG